MNIPRDKLNTLKDKLRNKPYSLCVEVFNWFGLPDDEIQAACERYCLGRDLYTIGEDMYLNRNTVRVKIDSLLIKFYYILDTLDINDTLSIEQRDKIYKLFKTE